MRYKEILKNIVPISINTQHFFMLSMILVNGGNYLYNLALGRFLGPEVFSDTAILITLLLVLSFVGMTFQIVTTKYSVLFIDKKKEQFIHFISKTALIIGVIIGAFFILFSSKLQYILNTTSSSMFTFFGIGIPIYFLMSVNRGVFQGENNLVKMSFTYQFEMFSRFIITLSILFALPKISPPVAVSIGVFVSFFFGLFPFHNKVYKFFHTSKGISFGTKNIFIFFAITAFYEFTQIIINNSDVILVKHYFQNNSAGLYASLALIGRVVYFLTWIFVMMLLPRVIKLNADGINTKPILIKYVGLISLFSFSIVLVTFLFPETIVSIMFGEKYLSIANLLWKYALATALFSVSNVFAYYYLSINKYLSVVISAILGFLQIILIILYHKTLQDVVHMQIISMFILLLFQLIYFFIQNNKYKIIQ